MIELMIVDDERFVVENLARTYPWAELGIGAVHEAYSAAEALDKLQRTPVQILITDIQMPGMNGLELINRIRELSPKTKCVLLTGYADFQYAKQAIASQVSSYLLKPVKEKELLDEIRDIVRQLESERAAIGMQQQTHYALRESLPLLRSSLLSEVVQGKMIPLSVLAKRLETYRLRIRPGDRFTMLIVRPDQGFASYDAYNRSLLEYAVFNIIEEVLQPAFESWHCKDSSEQLVIALTEKEPADRPEGTAENVHRYAALAQQKISHFLNKHASILIAPSGVFPDDMYRIYRQSAELLRYRTAQQPGELLTAGSDGYASEAFQPLRTTQEVPLLPHLLEAGRWTDAERKLTAILDEVRGKKTHLAEYLKEIALLIHYAAAQIIHKQGYAMSDLSADLLQDTGGQAQGSIDSLLDWGLAVIRIIRCHTEKDAKGGQRAIIQRINQYVQNHLERDVSLQALAEHVFLHPAYVSKMYKQETGEGLSDYIYRLRMEKAAELLSTSNERISDICRKTGYQNPSHFSRVFRKYYGMTPDAYREVAGASH